MKVNFTAIAAVSGVLIALFGAAPKQAMAQAGPGPLTAPKSQGPATPAKPRPKRPELEPRTTIAGAWKFNADASDDPTRKIRELRKSKRDDSTRDPSVRTGPSIGFPFPGSGGPGSGSPRGQRDGGPDDVKLLEVVRPATNFMVELKKDEVDLTVDESRKLIFFTDGRALQKPTDQTRTEIAARWDGSRLVSDEKGPEKGKLSREFELSQDGRQLYETLHVETGKSKTPVVLQYVYDLAVPPAPLTHETDPDQPIMKRHPDTSQDKSGPAGQSSDPDQPTMQRKNDDGSSTQSPAPPANTEPDPNVPVMKRRTN